MIKELNARLNSVTTELSDACGRLTAKRKECAQNFGSDVDRELADLGLKNAVFDARFLNEGQNGFGSEGWDMVEFYISTNPGEPLKPLKKIVSGGEISRIMLGLKNISSGLEDLQCLIFDEIDTGISGHMAHVVGEKMLHISQARQVICVTHLAQIASLADRHFLITKQTDGERARTGVARLSKEKRILEIARLAGGSESEAALKHAEELLERAEEAKGKK
jgi:DNA repair protein RecN (Recombination protein N)